MKLALNGIVAIVGHSGSGKTEISTNLATDQISKGRQVKIADLDLINPYFRTREVRHFLSKRGIQVILPPEQYLNADLPILTPLVSGMIKNTPELLILDLGGGGMGSRVLGALSCFLEGKDVEMLFIVNPYRPHTNTVGKCIKMRAEIEAASKIMITGIIGNANIMNETSLETIYMGYDFTVEVSENMGVPVSFITIPIKQMSGLDLSKFNYPILPIWQQLVPPWIKPEAASTYGL